jgi:hypothetical protein
MRKLNTFRVDMSFWIDTVDEDEAVAIGDAIATDIENTRYMDNFGNEIEVEAKVFTPPKKLRKTRI